MPNAISNFTAFVAGQVYSINTVSRELFPHLYGYQRAIKITDVPMTTRNDVFSFLKD